MRWKPSRANRAALTLPTPKMKLTGFGGEEAAPRLRPSTAKPRGLSRSEAILARNLLQDSPIETVMPSFRSTSAAKRASTLAGGRPCSRSVPERSRNASSIESGSTSGVSASISCAHLAADARIFLHVGPDDAWHAGTAAAPRTSASPIARRRCARHSRPRRRRRAVPPPTITGSSASAGSSRFSIVA